MGYHVVDPQTVEPMSDRPSETRSVSQAAGLDHLGLRVYEAAPGEQLPLAFHSHDEQEEAFYVLDGTLHVETPDRTYVVERDQVFVAEPDSPHRAFAPATATGPVRVLAVGAPSVDDVHAYE